MRGFRYYSSKIINRSGGAENMLSTMHGFVVLKTFGQCGEYYYFEAEEETTPRNICVGNECRQVGYLDTKGDMNLYQKLIHMLEQEIDPLTQGWEVQGAC